MSKAPPSRPAREGNRYRLGTLAAGVIGSVVIGVTFWLAIFGMSQLDRRRRSRSPRESQGRASHSPRPRVPSRPRPPRLGPGPGCAGRADPDQGRRHRHEIRQEGDQGRGRQPVEITLDNKGVLEHDLTMNNPNSRSRRPAGQTAKGTFTPPKEGSFEFYCSIPATRRSGMVGKLIVGGAAPAAQSAPTGGPPAMPGISNCRHAGPSGRGGPDPAPPAPNVKPLPAPQIAPPISRTAPANVTVEVETQEVTALMDDGVAYTYWTFGGTVPGPMLRVRQGDTVELTLKNAPDSKVTHSIDLHAVTGPGGGAKVTQIAPGRDRRPSPSRRSTRACTSTTAPRRLVAAAHRQRHVRPDRRRAAGGPAAGRPRVLRHAGRLLPARATAPSTACTTSRLEKMLDEHPTTSSSTARSARSPATAR